MYLKALEIQGFKSFPDKTVLTFGEDITAIVGPNGSGKSNISDAIRWVMGEQSTKALRGGKMEDVIFGGTEKRKQLGFAEVSLVLDNSGHFFPMEESEVMVTRRYYRSGESEYYINRRSVRLRDVNEMFMDTGLGREGYSIIGQGKIDEILSVKSGDRREVFEEAAGISRFRHRKEEAERKLTRTQENLVRIGDKIDELELQVEPLRQQSEKAQKFLLLRDELRGLEIAVWLEQLEKIRQGAMKTRSDFEHAVRQKTDTAQRVEELYAKTEELSAQMREKDIEAEGIRFEMMRREADGNEISKAVAVLKTNMENNQENATRVQQELEQQDSRAGTILSQIEERRGRMGEIAEELEALRQALTVGLQDVQSAYQSAGALTGELEELREREAVETASAAEAKALLSALAAAAQEIMDRDEALRRELSVGEARLQESQSSAAQAKKELEEAKENLQALQNTINGYTLRLENRAKKEENAKERQRKLQMDDHALSSRINMLSEMEKVYEGYSKAVKLVMGEAQRGQMDGVHGPVASLIQVPDQYAVAIEIALGGAMQHLVVEHENIGKRAIQYLKRRDGGRATFLPISTIRPAQFRDTGVVNEVGFVGMGDELVTFDNQYANVFSNLLGRTAIAEDMDSAIAIAGKYGHRFKIVTLDGQVLNAGGSMTGGSTSRSAGILSRANELERLREQRAGLTTALQESEKSVEEALREATSARYQLEVAQNQQRTHQDDILKLEERCTNLDNTLSELIRQRDEWKSELEQLTQRATRTEEDTVQARNRIETLEGAAAALHAEAEGKVAGRTDLQARQQEMDSKVAEIRVQLASLEAEENGNAKTLSELEELSRGLSDDREHRATMVAEFWEKNDSLLAEITEKEQALQAIQEENQGRQRSITTTQEEKLALEGQRAQVDRESRDKNTELLAMEREVSVLEQRNATAAMEEKQLLDKLWETYELSHEGARQQRIEIESLPKAIKRIGELKRGISSLGHINLGAIEEFQRVNERYTYLIDQRDDVEKAKADLETIIADITNEMKTIFAQQFQHINASFQETFLELFRGGKATLELEDESDILNCGIEIKVQPPGKALKIITLLSGGEKAFVAIALYFAILKVRPTPFCVMDEIEAALDDANVIRYADYLRKMSDNTQYIVITHRRGTMEEADVLYGVTMQEQGISRILTINLNDVEKELKIK